MPNPFFYDVPVTQSEQFIGRKHELTRIFAALETAQFGQAQHVSIVGPRRIGKSSLLFYIANNHQQYLNNPDHYRFAYLDLNDQKYRVRSNLLEAILKKLNISLIEKPSLAEFSEIINAVNEDEHKYLVVCLDQIDSLFISDKDEFNSDLFEMWRALGNSGKVIFLTTSTAPLYKFQQQNQLTSTFSNIFMYLELDEFTEEETRKVLEIAQKCDFSFSADELNLLKKLGGHHPARLQIAGSLIYNEKKKGKVNFQDIEEAFSRTVSQLFVYEAPSFKKSSILSRLIKSIFITFPNALGRAVFDVFGRPEASTSSAVIIGYIIVVLLLSILSGWISISNVVHFINQLMGAK